MTTIERFKNSRFGQLILVCFFTASIATAVVIWLYEDIRIPTLNGQISLRDDKIKSLEDHGSQLGAASISSPVKEAAGNFKRFSKDSSSNESNVRFVSLSPKFGPVVK